jgi:hypothetical protein
MAMRKKRLLRLGLLLAACAALAVGSAEGATVRVGTLVLHADGGFQPRVLPRRAYAPIRFQGHGDIRTTDGSVPPALRHVKVEFDRDGRLATAGLPVCPPSRIEATTVKQARSRCGGAIVGRGHVGAVLDFAAGRIGVRSPLTLFNGPRQDGNITVVAHAQTTVPVFQSYVVVVPIERRRGTFGYRSSFDIPEIAGGAGALTHIDAKIGRRYSFRGARRSYVSARCSDYILQTQGYFAFDDGNVVYGSVFKPCRMLR